MRKAFTTMMKAVAVATLLFLTVPVQGQVDNQSVTQGGQGEHSPQLGACGGAYSCSQNQLLNGSGSLGNSYYVTDCGLNYTFRRITLTQRAYWQPGPMMPVDMQFGDIPCNSGVQILQAYAYWIVQGSSSVTTSLTIENSVTNQTQTFSGTVIGTGQDKCWGRQATVHFRADVTSIISGNATYTLSGLPQSSSGNDTDGIGIVIIYKDPSQSYEGTLVIDDGCMVAIGGSLSHNMTGLSVCQNASYANSWICTGDMQNNISPQQYATYNSSSSLAIPAYFFNFDTLSTTTSPTAMPNVTQNQTSASFSLSCGADCYSWICSGLYFRTNCNGCIGQLPVSNLGLPDTTICPGNGFQLNLTAQSGYTYVWSPATGLSNAFTLNPYVNPTSTTTYTLSITDGAGCTSSDTMYVGIDPNLNQANAGSDTTLCILSNSVQLNGSSTLTSTGAWSISQGSGFVANSSSPTATVYNLGLGTNILRWIVNNGSCNADTDYVTVIVKDIVEANAGNDRYLCVASNNTNLVQVQLAAIAPAANTTGTWSVIAGTGIFANVNLYNTVVSTNPNNINTFRWTVSNGACPSAYDDVSITTIATPNTLTHTNVTSNSAKLNWSCANNPDSFQIEYRTNCTGTPIQVFVPGNLRTYTVTGLTSCTNYCWKIRTKCTNAGYGKYSLVSDTFTTIGGQNCVAVTQMSISNVSACNYKVQWSNCVTADSFRVRYQKASSPVQYSPYTTSNNVTLTLSPGTWSYRVQTWCANNLMATNSQAVITIGSCRLAGTNGELRDEEVSIIVDRSAEVVRVKFTSDQSGAGILSLTNVLGEKVGVLNQAIQEGENEWVLPVSQLASGIYSVTLENNISRVTKKVFINQ